MNQNETGYTRHYILSQIATDKSLTTIAKNITKGNQLTDDLIAELMLNLCEKNDKELNHLFIDDYYKRYSIKFFTNQYKSSKSPFALTYRNKKVSYQDLLDFNLQSDVSVWEQIERKRNRHVYFDGESTYLENEVFSKFSEHDKILFNKLYIEQNLSTYKIAKKLNMKQPTVSHIIRKIKNNIKLALKQYYKDKDKNNPYDLN